MIHRWIAGAALAALFVSRVYAAPMATDPMAEQVLAQMSSAFKNRAWSGMMMYTQGTSSVSLKFYQDVVAGQPVERIERLSGDPIQVMRRGNWLLGLYPGAEALRQGHSLPTGSMPPLRERLQHIKQHYTLQLGEPTRVAGRIAQPVMLQATDEFRFSRRYWCDIETGLMLRAQTLDAQGQVLEQFEFLSIELGTPIEQDTLVVDAKGMQVYRHALINNPLQHVAPLTALPPGFIPVGQGVDNDSIRTHLFTDGVSLVSVFYEPVAGPMPEITASEGPTHALSRVIKSADQHYKVTLVGETPVELLRRMSKQISPSALAKWMAESDEPL